MMERTLAEVGTATTAAPPGQDWYPLSDMGALAPGEMSPLTAIAKPAARNRIHDAVDVGSQWLIDNLGPFVPPELRGKARAVGEVLSMISPGTALQGYTEGMRQGHYGDAALNAFGLIPGEALAASAAKLAALPLIPGARRGKLPMDEASRWARAKEMGIYKEHPLAHGTAGPEFRAFDSATAGAMTGAGPARMGVWSEWHPERGAGIADYFAGLAAHKGRGDPRVIPLVHRAENPAALTLRGDETNAQLFATLEDAWARGHDSVLLKNYTRHGGKSGAALVVKDPAQLRSPFAVFDPAKKHVNDLLASLAVVPAAGAVGASLSDQQAP
jgi:hypothetical protein